jgi:hypothetical protein
VPPSRKAENADAKIYGQLLATPMPITYSPTPTVVVISAGRHGDGRDNSFADMFSRRAESMTT